MVCALTAEAMVAHSVPDTLTAEAMSAKEGKESRTWLMSVASKELFLK